MCLLVKNRRLSTDKVCEYFSVKVELNEGRQLIICLQIGEFY